MRRRSPWLAAALAVAGAAAVATPAVHAAAAKKGNAPRPDPAAIAAESARTLTTWAERTQYRETGRYVETEALCRAFEARFPRQARCTAFGTTPEGRPLLAIVASRDGALTPAESRQRGRPVVFVQAGIHAGEIDGKDAGFRMLREALEDRIVPGALARVTWVFVPVFNVDGHERFGAWHRPNQNGPAEMGWRSTSQNLNLNRDYMKADAPEMRSLLAYVNEWDPIVYADLHTTDGADFQHDVSVQVQPDHADDSELAVAARGLRDSILARLTARGSKPLPFYPSFVREDEPESGFEDGPPPPRFQLGYWPLSGRVGMLVETHSWKDYPSRVRATYEILVGLLEAVAREPQRWNEAAVNAARASRQLAGTALPLSWVNTDDVRTIDFLGYAYTRTPSAVSGRPAIAYDPRTPQVWRVPLRDRVKPGVTAVLPRGGYVVPPAYAAELESRLRAHGLAFERVGAARDDASLQVFRLSSVKFAPAPFEGRTGATLAGEWRPERGTIPAGSLYVPIAQPKARLVAALLEPTGPDSFAAWGLFNGAFERKEYMEDYVAEQVAREMLAKDPALAAEFTALLRKDPAFAASPAARLEFFYRRHPSWDDRPQRYPVLRVDAAP